MILRYCVTSYFASSPRSHFARGDLSRPQNKGRSRSSTKQCDVPPRVSSSGFVFDLRGQPACHAHNHHLTASDSAHLQAADCEKLVCKQRPSSLPQWPTVTRRSRVTHRDCITLPFKGTRFLDGQVSSDFNASQPSEHILSAVVTLLQAAVLSPGSTTAPTIPPAIQRVIPQHSQQ